MPLDGVQAESREQKQRVHVKEPQIRIQLSWPGAPRHLFQLYPDPVCAQVAEICSWRRKKKSRSSLIGRSSVINIRHREMHSRKSRSRYLFLPAYSWAPFHSRPHSNIYRAPGEKKSSDCLSNDVSSVSSVNIYNATKGTQTSCDLERNLSSITGAGILSRALKATAAIIMQQNSTRSLLAPKVPLESTWWMCTMPHLKRYAYLHYPLKY